MPDHYHHGDLRHVVLTAAAKLVADDGPDVLSLRELARRAGVSHAAPAHHFGDRRGLFTALAAEGFSGLAAALSDSVENSDFRATAGAYVNFAVTHPGHYAVMFRADLLDAGNSELVQNREKAAELLSRGMETVDPRQIRIPRVEARQASWALVHGLSSLWLSHAITGDDPSRLSASFAEQLFGS